MTTISILENIAKKKVNKKYDILLKLINKILKNINKNTIQDVIEFENIKREELLIDKNMDDYRNMEDEIYKVFNKSALKYNQKNNIHYYLLTVLKGMCNDLGLIFSTHYVTKRNGKKVETDTFYSIKL